MTKLMPYLVDTTLSIILSGALVLAVLTPSNPWTGEGSGVAFSIGLSISLIIFASLVFILRNMNRLMKRRGEVGERAFFARWCVFILDVIAVAGLGFAITIMVMILTHDMRFYGWLVYDLLVRIRDGSFISLDQIGNYIFVLSWLASTIFSGALVWSARRAARWWLVIYQPPHH